MARCPCSPHLRGVRNLLHLHRRHSFTSALLPHVQGLNVNGGRGKTSEIRVRLRPHHSPNAFLPYEDILGTMLHEITHNVRGPHDAEFYKVLDEVTRECEDYMARGIVGTGSGFDGPSCGRLGSHAFVPSHNVSEAAMKAAQIKCATAGHVSVLGG